jgi:hypothetical protein
MFLRRLGPDSHAKGAQTIALKGCPDIFELENGDFAIIGNRLEEAQTASGQELCAIYRNDTCSALILEISSLKMGRNVTNYWSR